VFSWNSLLKLSWAGRCIVMQNYLLVKFQFGRYSLCTVSWRHLDSCKCKCWKHTNDAEHRYNLIKQLALLWFCCALVMLLLVMVKKGISILMIAA
jgi:hypothetical protein